MMKNRPSTTAKFYVQHWNNREALRLAMHCHNTFTAREADATSTDDASSITPDGAALEELNPVVIGTSPDKVKDWLSEQEANAKRCFDEELSDDNLETFLSGEHFYLFTSLR